MSLHVNELSATNIHFSRQAHEKIHKHAPGRLTKIILQSYISLHSHLYAILYFQNDINGSYINLLLQVFIYAYIQHINALKYVHTYEFRPIGVFWSRSHFLTGCKSTEQL